MSGLLLDLHHAFRLYRRTPWQSALAIVTLAVAMALVGAMASLWSELHLASVSGVEDDTGLVTFGQVNENDTRMLGAGLVREFNRSTQTLTRLTGESRFSFLRDIDLNGEPITGQAAAVLPGYFDTLTPRVTHGRGLSEADFADQGARVLVLSHRLWTEHFDARPDVVGETVRLGDFDWRVVGIVDEAFTGIGANRWLFWAPYNRYMLDFNQRMPPRMHDELPFWRLAGRLADGVSRQAARAELARFIEQAPQSGMVALPDAEEVTALAGLIGHVREHAAAQRQVDLMLLATLLVAVVATINIATFLLARVPGRNRELALRGTVGATRRRLTVQLFTEAALLVACGAALGIVMSIWLAAAARELALFDRVVFAGSLLNLPMLAFCAVLALLLSTIVAAAPLSQLGRGGLVHDVRSISSRPGLFQHATGLIQLSLTGLLAAAAIGFLAHLWLLGQRDMGLTSEGVLVTTLAFEETPTGAFEQPPDEAKFAFRADVRERLEALPGVEGVSFGAPVPGQRSFAITSYRIGGESTTARLVNVAPGFFDVLDIALLQGRDFETGSEPGVIVSREFVRRIWGDTDNVLGRFIREGESGDDVEDFRILGVAEDIRYEHPEKPPTPLVFTTSSGLAGFMNAILVRGDPDPERLKEAVESALTVHLDELEVAGVRPLSGIIARLTERDRARARVTLVFGSVVVLMATFGFFAMQRFLVERGRKEAAIRMALGAGPSAIRNHVLRQAWRLALPGATIGGLLAVIATRWLVDHYLVETISPVLTGIAVFAGLLAISMIASMAPALRASRARPGELLKEE
jgi:putative ABC transport system permease protein